MERITYVKHPHSWSRGKYPTKYTSRHTFQEVVARLAAYEDTGLMPEEIPERVVMLPPVCYKEDGGECAYQAYDGTDEPIDECKECPLCCVDKQRHRKPPNDPLTLDELREMDGEPVWCVDDCGNGHWMIVHVYGDAPEQVECVFRTNYVWDGYKYRMRGGFGWRAYRRKPEEGNRK